MLAQKTGVNDGGRDDHAAKLKLHLQRLRLARAKEKASEKAAAGRRVKEQTLVGDTGGVKKNDNSTNVVYGGRAAEYRGKVGMPSKQEAPSRSGVLEGLSRLAPMRWWGTRAEGQGRMDAENGAEEVVLTRFLAKEQAEQAEKEKAKLEATTVSGVLARSGSMRALKAFQERIGRLTSFTKEDKEKLRPSKSVLLLLGSDVLGGSSGLKGSAEAQEQKELESEWERIRMEEAALGREEEKLQEEKDALMLQREMDAGKIELAVDELAKARKKERLASRIKKAALLTEEEEAWLHRSVHIALGGGKEEPDGEGVVETTSSPGQVQEGERGRQGDMIALAEAFNCGCFLQETSADALAIIRQKIGEWYMQPDDSVMVCSESNRRAMEELEDKVQHGAQAAKRSIVDSKKMALGLEALSEREPDELDGPYKLATHVLGWHLFQTRDSRIPKQQKATHTTRSGKKSQGSASIGEEENEDALLLWAYQSLQRLFDLIKNLPLIHPSRQEKELPALVMLEHVTKWSAMRIFKRAATTAVQLQLPVRCCLSLLKT